MLHLIILLNFPRAQTLWYIQTHRGTCQNIGSVRRHVHCSRHLYSMCRTLHKLPYILSASELHFSCIESAVGLHSETFGLPRLAGLQSCRKPLRSYPTHLLDVECTCEGYFVVLPLKIESDKCNLLICFLGFSSNCLGCVLQKINMKSPACEMLKILSVNAKKMS